MGRPCIHGLFPWQNFQTFEVSFGEAKQVPAFSFVSAGIKVVLLPFLLEQEQSSQLQLFFSLKIWTVSCHWLHSSSSVRGSISSLWDWTLLCDTSNKRLYFPVSEREKILEDHEALLQSYTDKHLRSFSQLMETSVCQAWLYAHVSCLSK